MALTQDLCGMFGGLFSLGGSIANGFSQSRIADANEEVRAFQSKTALEIQGMKTETLEKIGDMADKAEGLQNQTEIVSAIDTARYEMMAEVSKSWLDQKGDSNTTNIALSEYPKGDPEVSSQESTEQTS